jgi:PAS domain S-box-containing protein
MFRKILNRAMENYHGANMVIRMKAKLFLVACLAVLILLPIVIIYSAYAQMMNPTFGYQINYSVILLELASIVFILLILLLLMKGHFTVSAHLLLVLSLLTTWTVMILDRSSPISRLDTIVFILGILTMTPLAVAKRKSAILLYGGLNLVMLMGFAMYARTRGDIPHHAFIDYLADNTVAMIFITLTSYSVFVINKRALDQMESDLKVREKAERALLESQQRLGDIINFLPDATFAVDLERRVIIWNHGMEMMTGIPAMEILGKSGYAIPFYGRERPVLVDYVLDRNEETRKMYADIKQSGDMVTSEVFVPELGSDGAYLWSTAKPLYDAAGTVVGAIETIRDITERKRQEGEKARLEEQLLHAQKMESVGRLAGGVAHDFNNLLTAILGNTGLVMMEVGAESPVHARLKDVMKAAESATFLTRQLLAFSRKQVIEPRLIDLNTHIRQIEKLLISLIGEGIKPVLVLGRETGTIMADPGQIEQIIINLVINARDAMPAGGTLIIETREARIDTPPPRVNPIPRPGRYTVISVTDTGSGMSEDVIKHIFDPFFTTKPVGKGTGLGLASVYGAVSQNGGSIQVSSTPSKGTTMTIFFPVAEDAGRGPADTPDREDLPRGGESVLLAEDDDSVRKFIAEILTGLGYRVVSFPDGAGALFTARSPRAHFDLLLADVILPDTTGPVLAAQVLKSIPGIRILFMSGHAENEISHHGIIDNGINFIAKPFTAQSLAKKIRRVLDAVK